MENSRAPCSSKGRRESDSIVAGPEWAKNIKRLETLIPSRRRNIDCVGRRYYENAVCLGIENSNLRSNQFRFCHTCANMTCSNCIALMIGDEVLWPIVPGIRDIPRDELTLRLTKCNVCIRQSVDELSIEDIMK